MDGQGESTPDERVEVFIGTLLRAGVTLAAAVVFLGGVAYLASHGTQIPDYRIFRGEPSDLRNIAGIVTDAARLSRRGLIQFGLLLLIATPIVRVGFTVLAFILQKDKTYVLITLIVLGILLYSLVGAGW
ncbi:MAG: DUF1634 domain-containing protein [Desulfovibrionaceae bacterium]|nr:DUF1634 domain-containing protein [Desulfovibrionaceae bacterium]MBF0513412.1 DUF1634 domain-containing protein [Desulfovibrionaceae bacterium]